MWHVSWVVLLLSAVILHAHFVAWLQSLLAYNQQLRQPDNVVAQVGIILGYALHKDGSLTGPLRTRVKAGVDLFVQQRVDKLLFSGAHPRNCLRNVTEANAMSKYATELTGYVPDPQRWYLEEESKSTRENAVFSLQMLQQSALSSAVIVTNTFHQYRSAKTFQKAAREAGMQLTLYVAKVPFGGHTGYSVVNSVVDLYDFCREVLAIGYYARKGYT